MSLEQDLVKISVRLPVVLSDVFVIFIRSGEAIILLLDAEEEGTTIPQDLAKNLHFDMT